MPPHYFIRVPAVQIVQVVPNVLNGLNLERFELTSTRYYAKYSLKKLAVRPQASFAASGL